MTWDVWHHKRRILLKQDCVKEFPFPLIRDHFNGNGIWPFCRSLVCSFVTSWTGFRFQWKILKALKGKGYALLEMGRNVWIENVYFVKITSQKIKVSRFACARVRALIKLAAKCESAFHIITNVFKSPLTALVVKVVINFNSINQWIVSSCYQLLITREIKRPDTEGLHLDSDLYSVALSLYLAGTPISFKMWAKEQQLWLHKGKTHEVIFSFWQSFACPVLVLGPEVTAKISFFYPDKVTCVSLCPSAGRLSVSVQ